jgi:ribonuclease BN (tRNA processing enzyme)
MEYWKKKSAPYKKEQALKVLVTGMNANCNLIPITPKVSRGNRKHVLDGATGISIAGLQTNIAVPSLDITLDAGRNVEKVLERNLIVSHFDGDHVEGIGRAICNAINRGSRLDVFIPSLDNHHDMKLAIGKFMKKDRKNLVKIHEMKRGDIKEINDTRIEAFNVHHAPESTGFSVWKRDKGKWMRKLTYTGDINPSAMTIDEKHPMKDTEALIIDGTYSGLLLPLLEPVLDAFTDHGSTTEIKQIASEKNSLKDIGIIHLPLLSCAEIINDITRKLGNEDERIHYLPSCFKIPAENTGNKMAMFKTINDP